MVRRLRCGQLQWRFGSGVGFVAGLLVGLAAGALVAGASPPVQESPSPPAAPATIQADGAGARLDFETGEIEGTIRLDGAYHGVTRLVERRTGKQVIDSRYSALNLFKLMSVNLAMGQPRTMPRTIETGPSWVQARWAASDSHRAEVVARYEIRPPNAIDLSVTVKSLGTYAGYELFLSNFHTDTLPAGDATMTDSNDRRTSRRGFLRSTATAAVGGALTGPAGLPAVLAGPLSTQTLRVGLIGCGGRGTGAAVNALKADANVHLTAVADLFEDALQTSLGLLRKELPDQVRVERERCFLGFDAYQQLIDSGVDVVLLTTPPAFRPQHLRAAVQAGKHAFVEITAAIDGPGVRSVLAASDLAQQQQLSIVSGFCWRYDHALRAAQEQIRAGAIGEVRTVYSTYLRGSLSHKHPGPRPPGMGDVEWQLRDWYDHLWLSGDVTVLLSGGHSVDKMSWWLDDVMPVKAVATGSRVYPAEGNTFDNGFVAYEYAGGIRGFLACRSQSGCYSENADYVIGSAGTCTVGRGRVPVIQGQHEWRFTGVQNNKYQTEHDELFAAIRSGRPINDGTRMAHTTLMAILGRMAAYTGQEVTWEQALQSQQSLVPDKLDWNTKLDPVPLAMPGITKLL